jgi:hypothetical protein
VTNVVSTTAAAPSAVPTGNCGHTGGYVSIANPSDLDSISKCTTIAGDLIITPASGELSSIDLPSGLQGISGSLIFDGQSTASTVSITASGLSSVGSTQSTGAQGLSDIVTNSGLIIGNFPSLTNFSFPNLANIQSNFLVENNPQVSGINMPGLSNVGGNLDLTGNFNSLQLPDLAAVNGGVNVETTSTNFQCPSNIHGSTKGSAFNCEGNVTHPVPGQGLQYSASLHKSSSMKKASSKITLQIWLTAIDVEIIITALMFGWLMQLI